MNRLRLGILVAALLVVVVVAGGVAWYWHQEARTVNLLLWSGYDHPELLDTFSQQTGIKVNYKTFVGGDSMFSILSQSRDQYDVVVVDPEYIEKLHQAGRLSVLDEDRLNLDSYSPFFREFPLSIINGQRYSVVVEFGTLGLVYNTNWFSEAEVQSYDVLFSEKAKNKIGVWDWYLPIMGVLSLSLGHQKPYEITDTEFQELADRLMALRPQVKAIHAGFPDLLLSLAMEDTLLVPGGAEWAASALQQDGKPYDWVVPKEGGVMWVDSLVIPVDAPHVEAGAAFVEWMTTAEAQAILSQKPAFHANVPNVEAYDMMPQAHKDRLKVQGEADIERLGRQLAVRMLPKNQSESDWQAAWERFKAASGE